MTGFRRAYLYLAAAIALQFLTWGTISLVRHLARGPLVSSEAAAFQMALIVVALPVFLAHWRAVQRRLTADTAEAGALTRRVYLFGMLAAWLLPLQANLHGLLATLLAAALGTSPTTDAGTASTSAWSPLLAIVVLGVLVFWHGRLLAAEGAWRATEGSPATVRRAFVLGFAALGAVLTATAAVQLIVLATTGLYAATTLEIGTRPALPGAVARLAVGLTTWLAALVYAQRLHRRGASVERASVSRHAYLHGLAVASLLATGGAAAMLLAGALRLALGLPVEGTGAQLVALLLVGACGWLYHTLVLLEDAASGPPSEGQAGLVRWRRYFVAGIAMGTAVVAVAGLIQVLLRSQLQTGVGQALRSQLSWATALLAVAVPAWTLTWGQARLAAEAEGPAGATERASTPRRLYLYFYLLVATVVVLSGATYVLFRTITAAMGTTTDADAATRVAEALAYALVGAGLWLLQARQIRADDRRTEAERRARAATFRVVVLDPGGWSTADALTRTLADGLPDGAVARVRVAPTDGDAEATVRAADLAIAPWPVPGLAGELDRLLVDCVGIRLLVARRAEGWGWLGTEPADGDECVRQAVHAARQLVDGELLSPARRWTAMHVVGVVLGGLVLLVTLVLPIAGFVMGGGFLDYMAP